MPWSTQLAKRVKQVAAANVPPSAPAKSQFLRPKSIGRKVWLFFGVDAAFKRAARIASRLATARLHGADERRYLEWLLRELAPREWSPAAAARLLPEAWLAAKQQKAEEGARVEV
jgi:hypothetical protein